MRHFSAFLFLLLLPVLKLSAQQACDTVIVEADTAAFRAMLGKHDGILVDVRTPEEWKTGYIKGAINIDFRSPDFKQKIAKLDKSKTYYVYCEVGGRSRQAAEYMIAEGFCKVIVLDRGLKHWRMAGYPLVIPKK